MTDKKCWLPEATRSLFVRAATEVTHDSLQSITSDCCVLSILCACRMVVNGFFLCMFHKEIDLQSKKNEAHFDFFARKMESF